MSPEQPQAPTPIAPIASLDDPRAITLLSTELHDDIDAVLTAYGPIAPSMVGVIAYVLSTSGGMVGLIVAMVGGVLVTVLSILAGVAGGVAIWVGVAGGAIVVAALFAFTQRAVAREQSRIVAHFPTPAQDIVE